MRLKWARTWHGMLQIQWDVWFIEFSVQVRNEKCVGLQGFECSYATLRNAPA
ncbi:hypothetical protein TcasGA2_TC001077 [Tribolium castaneum]|uniref:Uncharacterized protein n=1 Tax=Tribolium castaneum TaxID=7070 RepID=D6WA00_TRICA|nr:hypothetical protein TcasGA2_TC001077 [Tribolium castaneum]